MRKLVLLFMGVLSFIMASAQTSYGLKAGVNLASLKSSVSEANDYLSSRTSFHVGAVAEFQLSDQFSIQPELLYNSVGAVMDYSSMIDYRVDATYEVDYVLDYLSIPVMAKYYVAEGFSLEAGPQLGFLLSSKLKMDDEEEDFKDSTESMDFGLGLGAGYKMENGLFFNARYVLGLSNVAKDMEEDESIKNNVFQFSLGYLFK